MPSEIEKKATYTINKLLGFDEKSSVKSYYPLLKEKIHQLEENESFLRDKSKALLNILEDLEVEKKKTKESEEKYRRFFEEDLSGVFISTPHKKIIDCNPSYVKMLEYDSKEELLNSNPAEHYPNSEDREKFLNLIRQHKKLYNYEGEIVTKNGKRKKTLENIVGVFDSNDDLIEFWGYVNDITEIKKAEEALKNAAEEKEALHRELLHRVKNSLNLIRMLVFFEREKNTDPKTNKILEDLELRIGTLSQMYSLLNLTGSSQLINLGDYLKQITTSLTESYLEGSEHIVLNSHFDSILTTPKTASSVGLILNELLTNSIKYAFPENRKGEILVSVKLINNNVEVKIDDNGIGVPDDFSIESSSGMGLQLVNMLTKQLNGNISILRENGTKISFVFPLDE